jgi:hypothetical protein
METNFMTEVPVVILNTNPILAEGLTSNSPDAPADSMMRHF